MSTFTVASANTYYMQMLREPGGFAAIQHADAILMQEVSGLSREAEGNMARAGYEVRHMSPDMGLAIAVHQDSAFVPIEGSEFSIELQAGNRRLQSVIDRYQSGLAHRFRARGMIALKLAHVETASEVTVATTHPVVPLRFRSRARQVRAMGAVLGQDYFDGPLFLGGDMNHYPAPGRVDVAVADAAGMSRVDIGSEPIWRIEGSNSESLGRVLAAIGGRSLDSFDAQLDALLYGGDVEPRRASVEDIASDHRAIVATFEV